MEIDSKNNQTCFSYLKRHPFTVLPTFDISNENRFQNSFSSNSIFSFIRSNTKRDRLIDFLLTKKITFLSESTSHLGSRTQGSKLD